MEGRRGRMEGAEGEGGDGIKEAVKGKEENLKNELGRRLTAPTC